MPDILQVDVNGQETFSVSMKILASFSGKLRKMFGRLETKNKTESLKLVFQDFPGGAEGFELIVRFCYNGGRIDMNPCNMVPLHSAASYLQIKEDQTTNYLANLHFLTCSDLLHCLKQCQESQSFLKSSSIVQEILDAVVENISVSISPFDFSCSDFSGDVSTNSSRSSSFSQRVNWLLDLEFLNIDFYEKLLNSMISHKLDHGVLCSFLLHYQKVRYSGLLSADEKCRIIEVVITSLCALNGGFRLFPFRNLCDILQACLTLKMGRFWLRRVERMIGSRLDEATLDDLMIPCHGRKVWAYDVGLVMRFLKIFLGGEVFVPRLRGVGFLMDLYLAEVAPDPHLRASKFLALALALPDSARGCCDTLCEVVHVYFKVHRFISEEEKIRICSVLNVDKLSSESLLSLASNAEFPACVAATALKILASHKKNLGLIRLDSSLCADEDEEELEHLSGGKECRNVQKVYSDIAIINVTCPKSGKFLPMLCS